MSPPLRPSDDLRELSPHEAAMQLEAGATLLYGEKIKRGPAVGLEHFLRIEIFPGPNFYISVAFLTLPSRRRAPPRGLRRTPRRRRRPRDGTPAPAAQFSRPGVHGAFHAPRRGLPVLGAPHGPDRPRARHSLHRRPSAGAAGVCPGEREAPGVSTPAAVHLLGDLVPVRVRGGYGRIWEDMNT